MQQRRLKSDCLTLTKYYESFRLLATLTKAMLHIQVAQFDGISFEESFSFSPSQPYQKPKEKNVIAVYQSTYITLSLPMIFKRFRINIQTVLKSLWANQIQIIKTQQGVIVIYEQFQKNFELTIQRVVYQQCEQKQNKQLSNSNPQFVSQQNKNLLGQNIYFDEYNSLTVKKIKQSKQNLFSYLKDLQVKLKYQQKKVPAQCQEIKSLKRRLEQNISQIYQYIEQDFVNVQKISYKFSQVLKHGLIQLLSQNEQAKCKRQQTSLKTIIIQPFLSLKSPQYQNGNRFEINFEIKKIEYYIAFGICNKKLIKQANYRYQKIQIQSKNIGCYLLDWHGQTWSDYQKKKKNKTKKKLPFKASDTIKVTFNPMNKILTFIKNQSEQQSIQIKINPRFKVDQLCFCAFVSGFGDQIKIINNKEQKIQQNQNDQSQNSWDAFQKKKQRELQQLKQSLDRLDGIIR